VIPADSDKRQAAFPGKELRKAVAMQQLRKEAGAWWKELVVPGKGRDGKKDGEFRPGGEKA